MRNSVAAAAVVLTLAIEFASESGFCVEALRIPVKALHIPWRWTYLVRSIGLSPNATVNMDLQTSHPAPNAFMVLMSESQLQAQAVAARKGNTGLSCAWRGTFAEGGISSTFVLDPPHPARYFLALMQAGGPSVDGLVGEISFVNAGGQQLPLQQVGVADVARAMSWLFLASGFVFAVAALRRWGRSRRLHALLVATVMLKALTLGLVKRDLRAQAQTGEQSMLRDFIWRFLAQIEGSLELLVFYVVGLGWKVTRAHLRPPEWGSAATMCTLSFLFGMLKVGCDTLSVCNGERYILAQFTLNALCYLVVVVAANFNIFVLQRQIAEGVATPETGALYVKHDAYCWFRCVFLFYVTIPSIHSIVQQSVVTWQEYWVVFLVRELCLWLTFTSILVLFRPGARGLDVLSLASHRTDDSGADSDAE